MRGHRRTQDSALEAAARSLAGGMSTTLRELNISDRSRLLTVTGFFCGDVAGEV
jgi:hypothetical protein